MTHRSDRNHRARLLAVATAIALTALAAPASAGRVDTAGLKDDGLYGRFIVTYKPGSAALSSGAAMSASLADAAARTTALGADGRRPALRPLRRMLLPGASVIAAERPLARAAAAALMRQIAADPSVEYVQIDGVQRSLAVPNDPNFSKQWHYADNAVGIRAPSAWNGSTGVGTVVAVIDTGILANTDLNANILPGYDFVAAANGFSAAECGKSGLSAGCGASDDGDGRDANPLDSSNHGHGTHVAGTIGAVTNNGVGVAGVAYGAKVVPLRVLGRDGYGVDSDVIDALVWASGGSVSGVPANPNPAEVVNLSLGEPDAACSAAFQQAINAAVGNGTTVVVAAGNSNNPAANNSPAGCANVVTVAASNKQGTMASYSSYGAAIDVTAPGGENGFFGPSATEGVISTIGGNRYGPMAGTSMASPHVAGIAALIQAASPTPKTPAQVERILKSTARPFAAGKCPNGCGAGLVDAAAAVAASK